MAMFTQNTKAQRGRKMNFLGRVKLLVIYIVLTIFIHDVWNAAAGAEADSATLEELSSAYKATIVAFNDAPDAVSRWRAEGVMKEARSALVSAAKNQGVCVRCFRKHPERMKNGDCPIWLNSFTSRQLDKIEVLDASTIVDDVYHIFVSRHELEGPYFADIRRRALGIVAKIPHAEVSKFSRFRMDKYDAIFRVLEEPTAAAERADAL